MNINVEIVISSIFILFVLALAIRIYLLKKEKAELILVLISMLSILFGLYLCIKNGAILDYGTKIQIAQTHGESMFDLGKTNILISLFFIVISILKYLIWKIKQLIK
jgi:hypothetical protein